MQFKNGDIFVALSGKEPPFSKLMAQKFPVKTSLALAKMAQKLNEQFKAIESVKDGLVKRYGKEEKGQFSVNPGDENWPKFITEFNELMNQDVEIVTEKVKLPPDDFNIEPSIMLALEPFIEVE